MSPKTKRLGVAAVAAVAAAAGLVIPASPAVASHAGTGGLLTESNHGQTIKLSDGSELQLDEKARWASWGPDGSKFAYINDSNDVVIGAYDIGTYYTLITHTSHPTTKQGTTWSDDGSTIFWSEQKGAGQIWSIAEARDAHTSAFTLATEPGFDYTEPDAGPNALVFQRQADSAGTPTGQADVWGFVGAASSPSLLVANAAQPAVSPDGTHLAFVRSDGTNTQIYTSDLSGGNVVAITSNAANHSNPTWSPDSSQIAFNQGTPIYAAASNGSDAANPLSYNMASGIPDFRPNNTDHVIRLSGHDRFGTAIEVSKMQWPNADAIGDSPPKAKSVVLSRSDTFADALGGSALAAAKQGPLLMTPTAALNTDTRDEIQRVLGNDTTATVYLLGSTSALSQAVADSVAALGYQVRRLAGTSRFDTAVAIATEINPAPDLILAATGMNYPDALGAGAAAGSYDVPNAGSGLSAVVVLTQDNTLPAATKTYIDSARAANSSATVFGIGKQGLAATAAYHPVNVATFTGLASSRYLTSWLTAVTFFGGVSQSAGLSTATNWPDSLAGGAFLAAQNAPMLITGPDMDGNISWFFDSNSPALRTLYVFGTPNVVSDDNANWAGFLMSGPALWDMTWNQNAGVKQPSGATVAPATVAPTAHRTLAQILDAANNLQAPHERSKR